MSKPIRFTAYSWAKLCFLRDYGDTEIGCFGMAETDDPLLITDLFLPKQECTMCAVELDGQSLLDYRAQCRRNELSEKHSFRVWIHTHPKMNAKPSATDEATYSELFTGSDWGVMLILSKTEDTYARVRYGGDGPMADAELDIVIDYKAPFEESAHDDWQQEYGDAVTKLVYVAPSQKPGFSQTAPNNDWGKPAALPATNSHIVIASHPADDGRVAPPPVEDFNPPDCDYTADDYSATDWKSTTATGRDYTGAGFPPESKPHILLPPYPPDTEAESLEVRIMWCSDCGKQFEVCEGIEAFYPEVCSFCRSYDIFDIDSYDIER